MEYLNSVYDLERLLGRIVYRNANPRDLIAFRSSLQYLPDIKNLLADYDSALLNDIREKIDPLKDLFNLIDRAIKDDPPITVREGGIIKDGYLALIDEYRSASTEGKTWLAKIEEDERNKTGIKNLRIKYNKVFGYFLEVTNSYLELVPDYFIRKQTLTGSERFITPELKELEDKILGANDKLTALEYDTFQEILDTIGSEITRIRSTAEALAKLDALLSLAVVAVKNHYVRPDITNEDVLEIKNGRHPVIEQITPDGIFIDNDAHLDDRGNRIAIITGPNMAGKSTYMRQVALIVLMAQIGSFVPAQSAKIGVVDRIFTRVGASDDLSSGQSTFMLEMNEVANILRNATKKSLIILDEIGRGTSTYDGLSIAWSVTEFLSKTPRICAKTLFATHYHELTQLEEFLPNVHNYHIAVKENGEDIIFLRKILPGAADKSYGIQVARLAGVPKEVTHRAAEILEAIVAEKGQDKDLIEAFEEVAKNNNTSGLSEAARRTEEQFVIDKLKSLNLNQVTPLEAMNLLYDLQAPLMEE